MGFIKLSKEVLKDIYYSIKYIVIRLLKYISSIIVIITPYISMYTIYYCYNIRGRFAIGGEVFLPILLLSLSYIINKYANHLNVGNNVPVPIKRFTSDEGGDSISIENNRKEELILYVYELENYLESRGLL